MLSPVSSSPHDHHTRTPRADGLVEYSSFMKSTQLRGGMEKAQKLIFIVGRSQVEKMDFSNDDEKDAVFFAVANDEDDMLNEENLLSAPRSLQPEQIRRSSTKPLSSSLSHYRILAPPSSAFTPLYCHHH
ncbi:hypothetical protein L1887_26653 [Cichorium endivia]|nr:hypothetical protein L1887_26653 [Cichorium endivia]